MATLRNLGLNDRPACRTFNSFPECNPDLRQPSRQAEVPRKGCFPVNSFLLRAKANHSFDAYEGLAGHRTIAGELCRTLYCVERTNLVLLRLLCSDMTSRLTQESTTRRVSLGSVLLVSPRPEKSREMTKSLD